MVVTYLVAIKESNKRCFGLQHTSQLHTLTTCTRIECSPPVWRLQHVFRFLVRLVRIFRQGTASVKCLGLSGYLAINNDIKGIFQNTHTHKQLFEKTKKHQNETSDLNPSSYWSENFQPSRFQKIQPPQSQGCSTHHWHRCVDALYQVTDFNRPENEQAFAFLLSS